MYLNALRSWSNLQQVGKKGKEYLTRFYLFELDCFPRNDVYYLLSSTSQTDSNDTAVQWRGGDEKHNF